MQRVSIDSNLKIYRGAVLSCLWQVGGGGKWSRYATTMNGWLLRLAIAWTVLPITLLGYTQRESLTRIWVVIQYRQPSVTLRGAHKQKDELPQSPARSLVQQPWKSLSVLAVANRAGCRRLSRDYPISDKWPFRCLAQDPVFRRLGLCDARVVRATSGIATSRKHRCVLYLYFVNLCFCFGLPRSVR